MSVTTIYYREELMLPSTFKAGEAILDKPMRAFFEDFLYEALKINQFSSCYFYIEAKVKKLDRMDIWYEIGNKNLNIAPYYTKKDYKHVMCLATDKQENLLVDACIEKITDIFFKMLKGNDYYDITVHSRLTGLKMPSYSSDIYRLQIDNLGGKMRRGLIGADTAGYIVSIPYSKIRASIISTTVKE